MKKTYKDLRNLFPNKEFRNHFKTLYSISHFLYNSIISSKYEIDRKVSEYIILTEAGKKLFQTLKKKFNDTENYKILYSIFLKFYGDELLVDVNKSNSVELGKLLNKQIISDTIKFPWIYGRVLYDKYFNEFEGKDEELTNQEALRLLKNTPPGVFQLGTLIVGPFGVLESTIERYLPPIKNVNLWHCSDPSCTAFHSVRLKNPKTILSELLSDIYKIFSETQKSDWHRFYIDLVHAEKYYDIDRLTAVPTLLIDAFGNSELKILLKDLIDSNRNLREKFPNIKKLKGSSSNIINNIDRAECFQLILLEEERKMIGSLEKLIENKTIYIPPTEIRYPHQAFSYGFYDIYHECSNLGIRSVSTLSNLAVMRLIDLIEKVNDDELSKKDLEWKLMDYKRDSFKETIENFVLHEGPEKIIKESLLYSPRQTAKAVNILYGYFKSPQNESDKNVLINKFLWKLGFSINIYPDTLRNLSKKNLLLKSVTQNFGDQLSAKEKEEIRSVAVNLFVFLEEILEHSLSFITWTLLSDHYSTTKFNYNFEDARTFMCSKLNGYIIGSNDPLRFDSTGQNTLFPLIEGFTALVEICDKYLSEGPEKYRRPDAQIPHFHEHTDLTIFPFLSSVLLFDIKQTQYEEIKSILIEIQREFTKNRILSVRNKLEHKERSKFNVDGFPTKKEIISACECIEVIFKKIVEKGIYPNVFLFKSSALDKYNRRKYELEDYAGKNIIIKPTAQFSAIHFPPFKSPQVISSIITIGSSNEFLRFKYEESSEYLAFWKDFPRKKNKIASVKQKNMPIAGNGVSTIQVN